MKPEALKKRIFSLVAAGKFEAGEALNILNELSEEDAAEPLAIVSMALRFPEADNTDQLWEHLVKQRNLVGLFPRERFALITQSRPTLAQQYERKLETFSLDPAAYAAWLRNIEQFEPEAFGLTPHEAQFMGPAERLFLQIAMEALSTAGYDRDALQGSRTGVFIAHTPYPAFEYLKLFDELDERAFLSNIPANLGYHLAYTLNLRGPVLTVNTSCSSSLAAVHLAKNALRQGDCDVAVVGGVNIILFPFWDEAPDYVVRSPRFRCASYDAAADGIIGGEGVAVVVLKRLGDALRDRDFIHAIIKGTGMSSDGTSNGMQVPNPDAQSQAIRAALADAQVTAQSIGYIEGHGAGTPVGDLIEVDGLSRAFRQDTTATSFCKLGSIKSNIGHMGDAAGIAGLIKTVLSLENKLIPGLAHFKQENPHIGFAKTPFTVSAENTTWESTGDSTPRRAGVNSLGISGTNVHVVVEEYPDAHSHEQFVAPVPILFSASTRWALWELMQSLTAKIERNPHWSLQDIAYTLNVRRPHALLRIGIFATSTTELIEKLTRLLHVRSFERIPETFFTQGIFLADEVETRALSLTHFYRYTTPGSAEGLALMRCFIEGGDITASSVAQFSEGRLLPLPVAPFKTKRIWPASKGTTQRDVSDLFFETLWEECPVTEAPLPRPAAIAQDSLWLVLSRAEDTIMLNVWQRLATAGARAILVVPGPGFAQVSDDMYEVAPDQPESFEQLFNALGTTNLARLAGIVHGFSLKRADTTMDTLEGLEHSQDEGVFSLFGLIKAVFVRDLQHPIQLTVVSSQVEQATSQDTCVPGRVTLFGLAKVISQEQPTISSQAIDHDLIGSPEIVASHILAEITDNARTRKELVAYRHGKRLSKVIERQAHVSRHEIAIREGGTYVIAGGTGYLGMQVGLFLSQRARVNIVLLARRPLPERSEWENILPDVAHSDETLAYKIASIQAMEASGSRVDVLPCDVTDPQAVAEVFSHIRSTYGPIHGAFMLVKQLYHLWIQELTFEQYRNGIYNRVKGTWLIEREIRSQELDFFVLFSSISSLMGTKSASECCAVNQYLDSMSGYLNMQGTPTHVLNFTLILDDKRDFGSKTPIPPIDFMDFQGALHHFFRNAQQWNLVSRFDMEEVHFLKPVLKIPFGPRFWQEVEAYRKEHSIPATLKQPVVVVAEAKEQKLDGTAIQHNLTDVWRQVLGVEHIQEQSNFFSCGGTSLNALRFVQLFRKSFAHVPFEVADLYGLPTFAAQIAYCTRSLCVKDDLADLFDALENDSISTEAALTLFEKAQNIV